jgi:hypothetical protein
VKSSTDEDILEADYRQIESLPEHDEKLGAQIYGKVIGILKPIMRRHFGSIDPSTAIADVRGGGYLVQVVAVDKKVPRILIRCRSLEEVSHK